MDIADLGSRFRSDTGKQIIRFGLCGVVATLVHLAIYEALYRSGVFQQASNANLVGAVFGIATAFVLNKWIVFEAKHSSDTHSEVFRFALVYGILSLIHYCVPLILTDRLGFHHTFSFFVALAIGTIWTFTGNKYVVFRTRPGK